jgi:hypothetical protein
MPSWSVAKSRGGGGWRRRWPEHLATSRGGCARGLDRGQAAVAHARRESRDGCLGSAGRGQVGREPGQPCITEGRVVSPAGQTGRLWRPSGSDDQGRTRRKAVSLVDGEPGLEARRAGRARSWVSRPPRRGVHRTDDHVGLAGEAGRRPQESPCHPCGEEHLGSRTARRNRRRRGPNALSPGRGPAGRRA